MKTIGTAILLSVLVIALASCSSLVAKPTETPVPTKTSLPTSTLTPTPSPVPSATAEKPSVDFGVVAFVYDSNILNATIEIPLGWETKDNEGIGGVFVADNWAKFTHGDPYGDAIGMLFLKMQNGTGSASSSLDFIEGNLGNALTSRIGDTYVEKHDNVEIAWTEYVAKPPADGNGSESYYLLAVITDGNQSISALTTVYLDRQDEVRPIALEIIKRVKFR